MIFAATITLLLWIAPPLELSEEERVRVYEMAKDYKYKAHCETVVLARVFLIDGQKNVEMECYRGQLV